MVTDALSHVPHRYTYSDGERLAAVISCSLRLGQDVVVSFRGVNAVPSSFLNGAFVSLLDEFPVDVLRTHLRIVDSTRQIDREVARPLQAA
jgi:hypothetical protein